MSGLRLGAAALGLVMALLPGAWPPEARAGCPELFLDLSLTGGVETCAGTNCGAGNSYNPGFQGCVLAGGGVPVATPGQDVRYAVLLPPFTLLDVIARPAGWDLALYAASDSIPTAANCVQGVDEFFVGDEETLRDLANATASTDTLFIFVDSYFATPNQGCGSYEIQFRQRPLETAGDDCTAPLALTIAGQSPVTAEGYTCLAVDDFSAGDWSCPLPFPPGHATPGPDRVYAITVAEAGPWSLQVTPTTGWDVALFLAGSCVTSGGTCIAAADWWGAGQSEVMLSLPNPVAGTTYYLIVDSAEAAPSDESCGGFDLVARLGGGTPAERVSWSRLRSLYRTPAR